jgi:phosphoribosylformimino-5-aminoimidazole carboxamide ribotide isomerase
MELYPAIDVRGGRIAHIRTGTASSPSVYGQDPAAAVSRLVAEGARWVHLVDVDRAHGTGSNRDLMRDLLGQAPLRAQVGGSLGAEAAIDEMFAWGAARVVVGCAVAATDPSLVGRLVARLGASALAVAIETTDGRVTPRAGSCPPLAAQELARLMIERGIRTVVHTDITRDGTLGGPDIAGAKALARLGLEIIVSGGIGSIDDLASVRDSGVAGAIVGRALHEGQFSMAEAMTCAGG